MDGALRTMGHLTDCAGLNLPQRLPFFARTT